MLPSAGALCALMKPQLPGCRTRNASIVEELEVSQLWPSAQLEPSLGQRATQACIPELQGSQARQCLRQCLSVKQAQSHAMRLQKPRGSPYLWEAFWQGSFDVLNSCRSGNALMLTALGG